MSFLPTRPRARRGAITLASVLVLLGVLAATYPLWPSPSPARPVINDISGRPLGCLAYDPPASGAASALESAVWTAMQHAGASATLNIQQLEIPAGYGNPQPLLASLVARHCTLIITLGPGLGKSAESVAQHAPGQAFLIADCPTASPTDDVETVNGATVSITTTVTTRLSHLRP